MVSLALPVYQFMMAEPMKGWPGRNRWSRCRGPQEIGGRWGPEVEEHADGQEKLGAQMSLRMPRRLSRIPPARQATILMRER